MNDIFIIMKKAVNTNMLDEIAQRLAFARKAFEDAGLVKNQKDFADRAGIKRSTSSNYEQALRLPKIEEALKLRDTYGLTLDWIYLGDPSGLSYNTAQFLKIKGGFEEPNFASKSISSSSPKAKKRNITIGESS